MGNFQDRLSNAKDIQQMQDMKNTSDPRSEEEISLTNHLVSALSALNTERTFKLNKDKINIHNKDWSNYQFVCFHGIPSYDNEFDFLELPRSPMHFYGRSFSRQQNLPEDEQMKRALDSTFENQAVSIHELFSKIPAKKNLILIYHSFGGFALGFYFYYYGRSIFERIKGMVDIGGPPLRFYTTSRMFSPVILETKLDQILNQLEVIHKIVIKNIQKVGFPLAFNNKYETLAFIKYVKSKDYGELFANMVNHPKILKLIIHGLRDPLFEPPLLNQKAVYFAYKTKLDPTYQKNLIQRYNQIYQPKYKVKNLQERFIFGVSGGQHSFHMQKTNHELIKLATHQYLDLIHQ